MPPDSSFLAAVALGGSPAQAFASHRARAMGIARYFAATRPLSEVTGQADERNTIALIAHLHAGAGSPAALEDAQRALHRLERGDGLMGTDVALSSVKRDYDMALKGLMTIAYRYAHLLERGDRDFILDELVPPILRGGHSIATEIVIQAAFATPETENHLLMIESSRYLVNQLLMERTPNPAFDNARNGLTDWMLDYMRTIARHDFLEFNSRPYARLALNSLLNLHEFAQEQRIREAAQILLDYTMVKFAISSSRGRRVGPFRRQQQRINHAANGLNGLYAAGGEELVGFFLAYTGLTDPAGRPAPFPDSAVFNGLIAGTAAYRPPPAAYVIALGNDVPPAFHRFFHGTRPQLPTSPDVADPGLELHYRSPSFLLSAGGSFLNSGYGHDEIDTWKDAWEQTSRAQATTLIPTRVDTAFHELVRFEPYPDPLQDPFADDPRDPDRFRTTCVNIGVHRGLIAGANLRPAEKKTVIEHETTASPALAEHEHRLRAAWKASSDDRLKVATVQVTDLYGGPEGLDGVEGVADVVTLGETSDAAPAIASHNGRLFIAWKGSGNDQLNLGVLGKDEGEPDGMLKLRAKVTLGDSSEHGPALVSHAGRLYLAWTGVGNERLNVAKVALFATTAGGSGIEGVEDKVVLGDTSEATPALASHDGRLFLAWKGSGNDNLNMLVSGDGGASFHGKRVFGEKSSRGPTLASHAGRLFLGWRGSGNENLNVAKVVLVGSTAGGVGIAELEAKVVLGEISTEAPALGSRGALLCLAWKGEGEDNLNFRVSRDGSFAAGGPWFFCNRSDLGFYLAAYRTPPARPDDLDPIPDTLGFVHAVESQALDFATFKQRTLELNAGLPAKLEYGAVYEFASPLRVVYRIWFQMTGQKYAARVLAGAIGTFAVVGDPFEQVDDLSLLPLVSGDYLASPGGHDGLIEIRTPGCRASPLVLDFRGHVPAIHDNVKACPQPWLDRADALKALADSLAAQDRKAEAADAMRDRVAVYQRLADADPAEDDYRIALALAKAQLIAFWS